MSLCYLSQVTHLLFLSYTILLFARIASSWLPNFQGHTVVRFIAFYTDPYLNIFRRLIPPLGGVLDLSPILAFFSLRIAETLILSLMR